MALIDSEAAAERLARASASDILAYHEAELEQGIRDDNVFEVLAGPIAEHRKVFMSRVGAELASRGIFERALVDTLFLSKGHIPSPMW